MTIGDIAGVAVSGVMIYWIYLDTEKKKELNKIRMQTTSKPETIDIPISYPSVVTYYLQKQSSTIR